MSDSNGGCSNYLPISAYAVVGDCHTAALISNEGSIDWYCPGRFDAPAVFCRILDASKGGYLRVAPRGRFAATRRYRGRTSVLDTIFDSGKGRVKVTDLMPVHARKPHYRGHDVGGSHRALRLVEVLDGEVELELRFKPTFNYARDVADVELVPGEGVVSHRDGSYLTLSCPGTTPEQVGDGEVRACWRVRAGDRLWITLTWSGDPDSARQALAARDWQDALDRTMDYWERWSGRCAYRGPYQSEVLRSALTLKMLIYEPTGAIIAAPTTSLPEAIGGLRNWDYRYSWLRDSSLILYALITVGYSDEAKDFLNWLVEVTSQDPLDEVMFTIDGKRRIPEITLDRLEGYRCSKPVRIGNRASGQVQLDVYGEILRAAYLHYHDRRTEEKGMPAPPGGGRGPSRQTWELLQTLVEQAVRHWREPDNGIWEVRGERRLFLHSRLMCWAAVDRGIRMASEFNLPAPMGRWQRTRDLIRDAILKRGWDAGTGTFTQALDETELDASALLIPETGFLSPTDPRVLSTIKNVRERLTDDGLVYRYIAPDGLPGGEATFALCSFWLVDALALSGQLDEAHDLFERLLGYANDVGLLSEEISPGGGDTLLGNFPQGLTHLALIRSASNLAKVARYGAEEHPETEAQRARRAHPAVRHDSSGRPRRSAT